MNVQYVTDSKGKKKSVILTIKDYENMLAELQELDELEDVKLFDKAKNEDDGKRIHLSDYLKKRKIQLANVHN